MFQYIYAGFLTVIILSMQRITAKDALDAEYFWTDPLPCAPSR
jgi:hypothetical protein